MTPLERRVRALIYAALIETGRAPDLRTLCDGADVDRTTVEAALARLAERHLLVLGNDSAIWMAHPFSAVPTAFPVTARQRRYYANCAWDAAGVMAMVGDGRCTTACPDCDREMTFAVRDGEIVGDGLVHFVVPARRFWDDIAFT